MRSHLAVMDPREFQYFVADFFCSLGYKVQVTSGSNDGGKDIILYKGNEMKFVEVKRYTKRNVMLLQFTPVALYMEYVAY